MGLYIYYPERDVFEPFKQLSDEGTTIDNAAAMIVGRQKWRCNGLR